MSSKDTTQRPTDGSTRSALARAAEKPADPRHASGRQAEELAAQFLAARGLTLLAHNFRCRGGEIDLICRDAATIVFVEVRLRRNARYGGAGASIGTIKQRRVILAARHWLARQRAFSSPCRFDCVLLDELDPSRITWLRGAFTAD